MSYNGPIRECVISARNTNPIIKAINSLLAADKNISLDYLVCFPFFLICNLLQPLGQWGQSKKRTGEQRDQQ